MKIRTALSFLRRWAAIGLSPSPPPGDIRVFYGHDRVPAPEEVAYGGIVKFQRMQGLYPNSPRRFNVLYAVSSKMPRDLPQLLWLARRKGARIVWNQNGVAYPAWHGPGWEKVNHPMARALHEADHVFYQSRFCKESADRFLGERRGPYEILYNCVDTRVYTPLPDKKRDGLVLLLGGNQYQQYRLEAALHTLTRVKEDIPDARLRITGLLRWGSGEEEASRHARELIRNLGLQNHTDFVGAYNQTEAPEVLRQADILLHTKVNDPCPGLVVEAMACGLPVVYSRSGGVPELVGDDAGVGVPAEADWERESPPDPEALAQAVLRIAKQLETFSQAARRRAVDTFDLEPWLQRHKQVFEELVRQNG